MALYYPRLTAVDRRRNRRARLIHQRFLRYRLKELARSKPAHLFAVGHASIERKCTRLSDDSMHAKVIPPHTLEREFDTAMRLARTTDGRGGLRQAWVDLVAAQLGGVDSPAYRAYCAYYDALAAFQAYALRPGGMLVDTSGIPRRRPAWRRDSETARENARQALGEDHEVLLGAVQEARREFQRLAPPDWEEIELAISALAGAVTAPRPPQKRVATGGAILALFLFLALCAAFMIVSATGSLVLATSALVVVLVAGIALRAKLFSRPREWRIPAEVVEKYAMEVE